MKTVASASFARPANTTAYAANDILANNAVAASVVVPALSVSTLPGVTGTVTRVRLAKSNNSLAAASFRVHLFSAAPVVTSGDNAAIAVAGVAAGYVGHADVAMDTAFTDGAFGATAVSLDVALVAGSRKLYAVIEVLGAYAPVSGETFTITAEFER